MKNILVISFLFFAFFTIQAQTDSIYRERFVKKVNAYRINKGKVKKTLRFDKVNCTFKILIYLCLPVTYK